jgi:hypothetical protein
MDPMVIAFGCVLLASALVVLSKAGASVPPAVLIGVPVCVGIFAWWLQRSRRVAPALVEASV